MAADRSAWNPADLRGEAERLIAAQGVVAHAAVRTELAEDLTARAQARCVPLLKHQGVPEHIRTWTAPAVLEVEADLTARLAARGSHRGADALLRPDRVADLKRIDGEQGAAAEALGGQQPLVVVEGAAGAGKTTMLATTRRLLAQQGSSLLVVTPTLRAAKAASAEVGAAAGSAAWLAFQHGWRWNADGAWTRLAVGQADPVTGTVYSGPREEARLRPGDLLVVDEAGMLDQDTARALLTVADECRVRIALLGDRHQLPAVGRGGVLDLAVRAADPDAHRTLNVVHRFIRTDAAGRTVPDAEYAELTLAMRRGDDPRAVFDALRARGRICLYPDAVTRREALAGLAAAAHADGDAVAVVVDNREQAGELNAAIRDRLVADGRVDDARTATTRAGQRIGAGDRIATRRNDRDLGVANRDAWIVTAVGADGALAVTPADLARGDVTPAGVTPAASRERVLPAGYVTAHVELAYASTAHGVQGGTVTASHVVVGERTGAAAAYVGMTRGRTANTAHLVASDPAEARTQWMAVFARDRADLGPAHAAELAAAEAARHAAPRPLDRVLTELNAAWTAEQRCLEQLNVLQGRREVLRSLVAVDADHADQLAALEDRQRQTATAAQQAKDRVAASGANVAAEADRLRDALLDRWDAQRDNARQAVRLLLAGPGRLGLRRGAVHRAREQLAGWADRWRPYLPILPADPGRLASLAFSVDDRPCIRAAFDDVARRRAEAAHPEHARLRAAVDAARTAHDHASRACEDARRRQGDRVARLGLHGHNLDPAIKWASAERDVTAAEQELAAARTRIAELTGDPALLAQPPDRLVHERQVWCGRRDAERAARRAAAPPPHSWQPARSVRPPEPAVHPTPRPGARPGIGR